jgi:tRNA pseudouridine38-40 synthase
MTIQQAIEEALADLTGVETACVAAGRTDAGVHARGQVVSFRTTSTIPPRGILHGVNHRLPEAIGLLAVEEASPDFHAQRDALGKRYRYRILNRDTPRPLDARTTWRVAAPLDLDLMSRAADHLIGIHDFTSFRNHGSVDGDRVRTVRRIGFTRDGERIDIDVEGDGFLYRMVRNITGTLVLVGRGALPPPRVREMLLAQDRRVAGPAAPARGLCLMEVFY